MMPERTQGTVTLWATSQSVMPRADAPSLGSGGTCWKRSRVVEVMIGHDHEGEHDARREQALSR